MVKKNKKKTTKTSIALDLLYVPFKKSLVNGS